MKHSAFLSCLVGTTLSVQAQYFGDVVFLEGFDSGTFPAGWEQTDESASEKTSWEITDTDGGVPFSLIDPASTGSAQLVFNTTDTRLSLISEEIDLAGKSALQVGFYGYDLSYCFRGGEDFRFGVSGDGGATWTDLFCSLRDKFGSVKVKEWDLYRYTLPGEFAGGKIRLRFYVDASTAHSRPQGIPGYIDGIFVSETPETDFTVSDINYSKNERRPTYSAFGCDEPVVMTIINNGRAPVGSAIVWYSVNDGDAVEEEFVPVVPLEPQSRATYRFTRGANLSLSRGRFKITCGVRSDDDPNQEDNRLSGYAENIVASLPYVPDFINEADLDDWTTDENGSAYWDYEDWNEFYWYIEPEYSDGDVDAWIVSRPVWLEAGKSCRVQFSACTDGDGNNSMQVLASHTGDIEDGIVIWDNESIDGENAMGASAVYRSEASGPCYFIFRCYSPESAAMLVLKDFAFHRQVDTDAAVTSIETPVAGKDLYSPSETLTVRVANKGSRTIAAGEMTLNYSINGEKTVTETSRNDIEPGSDILFSFSEKIDISQPGRPYSIKVWLDLDNDEEADNNSLTSEIVSTVTAVPYIPDFGNSVKSPETAYWDTNDRNDDGYAFISYYDPSADKRVYCFGGGMIGLAMVTVPTSDEQLLSRPVRLEAGSYKLSFMSMVGIADVSMPLDIFLYKISGGSATKVGTLRSGNISDPTYTDNILTFDIKDDGIYRIGFEVVNDKPVDFRLYLADFRLSRLLDVDLSVEDIILPTDRISTITDLPVGVTVRNNGTEAVTSFTLKASSPSAGEITCRFENSCLDADGTYDIYFPEDFRFGRNNGDSEELEVSVTADNDGYAGNNSAGHTIGYREPESVPYAPLPHLAMDEWIILNHNRDLTRFRKERTVGNGYIYHSDGETEADDVLATPGIRLEKDRVYSVSFSYYTGTGNSSSFNVSAFDAASGLRHSIAEFRNVSQETMTQCVQYFTAPATGDYNICFSPEGKTGTLFVSGNIKVDLSAGIPDLRVTAVGTSSTEAVFGTDETFRIDMLNAGTAPIQGVPVTVSAGGRTYHATYSRYMAADGESHSLEISGIDLCEPGTYELEAAVHAAADANPSDNTMSVTVRSLPVVDVALTGIVSPVSGPLGSKETVGVVIENRGKGDISGIDLSCEIVGADGGSPVILTGICNTAIAGGDKAIYEFPVAADFSAEGTYNITVTAVVENDINGADNILATSVNSTRKNLDAGVRSVDSPVDNVLTASERIMVTVGNYSEIALYDVPVTATVTGADGNTVARLNGIIAEIPENGETQYTFESTADMARPGKYVIEVSTGLPSDVNPDNDACSKTVRCLGKDVGVTAIISPATGVDLKSCDVTVEITNFGEAPVSDFLASYQIGSMPQLATVGETVEPGEKLVFTFPAGYEFTAFRDYTVTARTMLPDDINPDNDMCEVKISNLMSGLDAVVTGGFSMSPNPSRGNLHVTCASEILKISIYDGTGKLVYSAEGNNSAETTLSLDLPSGLYIVVLADLQGQHSGRLLIER